MRIFDLAEYQETEEYSDDDSQEEDADLGASQHE